MASGRVKRRIKLWCIHIHLFNWESLESMTDEQVAKKGEMQRLDVMSPLTSLSGQYVNYFYDQMEVEKQATPAGLGMADGDTLVIWDLASHLNVSEPEERKGRLVLRKRMLNLTSQGDASSICRGLNPVIGEDEQGLPFPVDLLLHSDICTAEEDVAGVCSDVADTQHNQDATDWARDLMLHEDSHGSGSTNKR